MIALIFDTETTGLPEKGATVFQHNKWPYIIQLSYIIYNFRNNTYTYINDYINIDESIEISNESFNIHKISKEFLNSNGISIKNALKKFNTYLNQANIIIGHNLSFDKCIVLVECFRNNIIQKFTTYSNNKKNKKTEFCTMKRSIEFCNISRINKFNKPYLKTPSLKELFNKCFPDEELPNNLHDAFIDILITFRCYYKLTSNNDILLLNSNLKTTYYDKLKFT